MNETSHPASYSHGNRGFPLEIAVMGGCVDMGMEMLRVGLSEDLPLQAPNCCATYMVLVVTVNIL